MALSSEDREKLEGLKYDAHFAASKYLESQKDIHRKLLEVSVNEALETLKQLKEEVQKDEMVGNYKIHLLVPFQLVELLNKRKKDEKSTQNS